MSSLIQAQYKRPEHRTSLPFILIIPLRPRLSRRLRRRPSRPPPPLGVLAHAKGEDGNGPSGWVRSGLPQANEMVRGTISSDERRELGREAGPRGGTCSLTLA